LPGRDPTTAQAGALAALALLLWTASFLGGPASFWPALCASAVMLMILSLYCTGSPFRREEFTRSALLVGLAGGLLLYGIFFTADRLTAFLPFPRPEAADIYQVRQKGLPFLLLFLLVSPAEEFFWRGFLQRWAMEKFGPRKGWFGAAGFYALVHLASLNIMFVGAALVSGLFWGFMYMMGRSLVPVIICHASWTLLTFVLLPLN
jgi:membrane protease YdiL (CAAX protease family)